MRRSITAMLSLTLTLSMSPAAAAPANIDKDAALRASSKREGVDWSTIGPPPPRRTKRAPSRPECQDGAGFEELCPQLNLDDQLACWIELCLG
ncbi:hypothetical protein DL764_004602 [Monosporascus ibericus]|uniref:Uncharacterized protein n=1 Tax=Monosporascus ibericus TaxID=155417 RepID=A0A4Q4TDZ0_9PEZI|nr:hypothetical protein DL764_004602 [Monosporascus ibericus]